MKYLILAIALILTGCETEVQKSTSTTTSTATQTTTSTAIAPKDLVIKADMPAPYVALAVRAVDAHGELLLKANPSDMATYCPNYAKKDRVERIGVWVTLISALARYESNFKPEAKYTESFKDAKGQYVVSRGLLQISQESANGYGCNITKAEQLHDPATNLNCGVKIMQKWVHTDGVISSKGAPWKGLPRYWSPFRKVDRTQAIRAKVKQVCQ